MIGGSVKNGEKEEEMNCKRLVAGISDISLDNLEKRFFVTLSNKMFSFPS